jgi:hypothetical protein
MAKAKKLKLKLVVKEVNKPANVVEIEGTDPLVMMQQTVGGYVQPVGIGPGVTILMDEDGLAKGLGDNCGFVGTLVFVEEVLISEEEGYDWGSLSEDNQRKALAWCAKHDRALHPDRSGKTQIIFGEEAIRQHRERAAADAQSKLMEWQSL